MKSSNLRKKYFFRVVSRRILTAPQRVDRFEHAQLQSSNLPKIILLPEISFTLFDRAVDNAFLFQREMDDYGKLFSIIESVAKWFPELSGYRAGRESSVELYDVYKVLNIKIVINIFKRIFHFMLSLLLIFV